MHDELDAFIAGVAEKCASLSVEQEAAVWLRILDDTEAAAAGEKSAAWQDQVDKFKRTAAGWADSAYPHLLKVPGQVMTTALGAAASVPLTAMFGKRDRDGKKHYLRNALIGAAGGAALPLVYQPKWYQNHENNRTLGMVNEVAQAHAPAIRALQTTANLAQEGSPERMQTQQDILALTGSAGELRETYGKPGTRWRGLLEDDPKQMQGAFQSATMPAMPIPENVKAELMRGMADYSLPRSMYPLDPSVRPDVYPAAQYLDTHLAPQDTGTATGTYR